MSGANGHPRSPGALLSRRREHGFGFGNASGRLWGSGRNLEVVLADPRELLGDLRGDLGEASNYTLHSA